MGKVVILLFIILLALASMAGYLFLTLKTTSGENLLAAGQKQVNQGQQLLTVDKTKLSAGERQLSGGKRTYHEVKDIPIFGWVIAQVGRQAIVQGKKQIAEGKSEIKAGEGRLSAADLELSLGSKRLRLTDILRIASALGATIFITLSIVLGFYWRRSLARSLYTLKPKRHL